MHKRRARLRSFRDSLGNAGAAVFGVWEAYVGSDLGRKQENSGEFTGFWLFLAVFGRFQRPPVNQRRGSCAGIDCRCAIGTLAPRSPTQITGQGACEMSGDMRVPSQPDTIA